ncbi:Papain-like cysteine protease c1, partial [Globisporangium splendens]
MKTLTATLAVAAVAFTQCSTATSSNRDELKAEFLQWKASAAGQTAYENGFVPVSHANNTIVSILTDDESATADELLRFENAKLEVLRLQKEQPNTVFSVETPFALLTAAEFASFLRKSNTENQRKLFDQEIVGSTSTSRDLGALHAPVSVGFLQRHLSAQDQAGWVPVIDWQAKGCVTRVKNQGQCGVCWAFAAAAALESGYCVLKGGILYELSEQDIVSCSRPGPGSCEGGWTRNAYDWMNRLNGGSICTEVSYPYTSVKGVASNCRRYEDPSFKCVKPNLGAYFYDGGRYSDHTLLEVALRKQPVSSSVNADLLQYYKSGVLMGNQATCDAIGVNHEVLTVGFGTLNGIPSWKVKNQWTASWGDSGYAYIERGYQGHAYGACGIENYGYFPVFPAATDASLNLQCTSPRGNVEIVGTTIKTIGTVLKAQNCCDKCRQEAGCKAYVWKSSAQTCTLKSTITGENRGVASVYSGSIISKAESLQVCAAIEDNVDYPGNDLETATAATAEECCALCTTYETCNAFTWSKFAGGMCYLKSKKPSQGTPQTPPADGSPYFRSSGVYKCQAMQVNVDFNGDDLINVPGSQPRDCCVFCRSTPFCQSFTWTDFNGGTCWLKGAATTSQTYIGAYSALLN